MSQDTPKLALKSLSSPKSGLFVSASQELGLDARFHSPRFSAGRSRSLATELQPKPSWGRLNLS